MVPSQPPNCVIPTAVEGPQPVCGRSFGCAQDDSIKSAQGDSVKSAQDDGVKSAQDDSVKSAENDRVKSTQDDGLKAPRSQRKAGSSSRVTTTHPNNDFNAANDSSPLA